MSEWFERFGGSSLCRGKNEPVPGECEQEIERRKGTGSPIRLIIIDPLERIDDRFDAAEFHVGRTGTPVLPQSAWWVGRRKNGDRHRGRSQSPFFLNRTGGSGERGQTPFIFKSLMSPTTRFVSMKLNIEATN